MRFVCVVEWKSKISCLNKRGNRVSNLTPDYPFYFIFSKDQLTVHYIVYYVGAWQINNGNEILI